MTWVNDVWQIVDREQLANVVQQIPNVLFAAVKGVDHLDL
jgi:hypothetical protein